MANMTVLITGASTGIGKATAQYFLDNGWNVCATMRDVSKATFSVEERKGSLLITELDVTKSDTIDDAIEACIGKFGNIDVLVNNAGFGVFGPFETISNDQVRSQFETNVFGLTEVTRRVLPLMRKKQSGVVINVSSVAGVLTFAKGGIYSATKYAVEAFTEALSYEMSPFGIKVCLVQPGLIDTSFQYNQRLGELEIDGYEKEEGLVIKEGGSSPHSVAKVIYRASIDDRKKLRYQAGKLAKISVFLRRVIPDMIWRKLISLSM